MRNILKNKVVISVTLLLVAAILVILTVLVCDKIVSDQSMGAQRVEFYFYRGLEDYEYLVANLGNIISEEDYDYLNTTSNSNGRIKELSVTQREDGSVVVIEFAETSDLLGGYVITSVNVFRPDELDEFVEYMYGLQ